MDEVKRCKFRYRCHHKPGHVYCPNQILEDRYCEHHHKVVLLAKSKENGVNHFRYLPPEIIVLIVEFTSASNICRVLDKYFNKSINQFNLKSESGWLGAIWKESYRLTIYLMDRKAPIELYVAMRSRKFTFINYRLDNEVKFAYWELSTSIIGNSNNSRRDFDRIFEGTMRFYLADKKVCNFGKNKSIARARIYLKLLLRFSLNKSNFELTNRILRAHFARSNDRMIDLMSLFHGRLSWKMLNASTIEFLYKYQTNFQDENEKLAFTKELIEKITQYKSTCTLLVTLKNIQVVDPKFYQLLVENNLVTIESKIKDSNEDKITPVSPREKLLEKLETKEDSEDSSDED